MYVACYCHAYTHTAIKYVVCNYHTHTAIVMIKRLNIKKEKQVAYM